eukprot:TRINITY_DN20586_c0_g1::TRINITY_DN20586_c0_g1_i1::g.12338::m.12338 TRINITY_DN20586_c0_g1::TRINITY_DN20586_c0_g1_i1::g.12338  ORF type:complete len:368 (+),score=64.56,sp/Q8TCT7/SPP2B_HUMAN/34.36/4e-15,PA/PF02225.17/1.2e-11,PA/PF02225.17/4.7e+03 TRINITY_DN20586_c0_g1_i1:31-1134(+)
MTTKWSANVLFFALFLVINQLCSADYCVLEERDPDDEKYCAEYVDDWDELENHRTSDKEPIVQAEPFTGCPWEIENADEFMGRVVFFLRGSNCTFYDRAQLAQEYGATGVVIVSKDDDRFAPETNDTNYDKIHIPVVMVSHDDGMDILNDNADGSARVTLYAPRVGFDWAAVIMWTLAVGCVSFSAYLANPRITHSINPHLGASERAPMLQSRDTNKSDYSGVSSGEPKYGALGSSSPLVRSTKPDNGQKFGLDDGNMGGVNGKNADANMNPEVGYDDYGGNGENDDDDDDDGGGDSDDDDADYDAQYQKAYQDAALLKGGGKDHGKEGAYGSIPEGLEKEPYYPGGHDFEGDSEDEHSPDFGWDDN